MARKKKPARTKVVGRRFDDALFEVDLLFSRRQWAEARALLDKLDGTYPQNQGVLERLVEVGVKLGDAHIYQYGCEKLYALRPHDRDLPFMLTVAYLQNRWSGLALAMARRALEQDPTNERVQSTRRLLADLEPMVKEEITRLNLNGPDELECLVMHDKVRSLLAQGRFAKASEIADQLAKRQPQFAPAYNNGAEASYHDGHVKHAVEMSLRLLAVDPNNLFALCNLVRFLCASGKMDEANLHAERLRKWQVTTKSDAAKQAEALAWLGDDAGVLAVFEGGRSLGGAEGPEDDALLYHLAAVAVFRQGDEKRAHSYWQAALRAVPHFELARGNLEDLRRPVSDRNAPWSYTFRYFVPQKLLGGVLARMAKVRGKDTNEEAQRYLESHPELEGLVPMLLDRSDGPGQEVALHLTWLFRTPKMLQAVRTFALGQRGSDQLRFQATSLADAAGLMTAIDHPGSA